MASSYKFSDFYLNLEDFSLSRLGAPVEIKPKVFDLLCLLIEHRERVLTREEIFSTLWSGREVCDTTLSNHIKSARQALGDNGRQQCFIRTVHGRGYQFIGTVELASKSSFVSVRSWAAALLLVSIAVFLGVLLEGDGQPEQKLKSIAVLPVSTGERFSVLAGDTSKRQALEVTSYFNNGEELAPPLPQQIINDLIYIDNLHVRSWARVQAVTNRQINLEEIAELLAVDYLLSSHYQRRGERYELIVELLSTKEDTILWRKSTVAFSWPQLLSQHGLIASEVIAVLKLELGEADSQKLQRSVAIDPKSYQHYFQALSLPRDESSGRKALSLLQESLRLNPDFAPAYVELASRMRRFEQFVLDDAGVEGNAELYLLRAIELDSQSVEALFQLSLIYAESDRLVPALHMARDLQRVKPAGAESYFAMGYVCRYAGAIDCARKNLQAAVRVDPKNSLYRSLVGFYSGMGEYQKIIPLLDNYRPSAFADAWLGIAYYRLGETNKAEQYLKKVSLEHKGLWGHVADIHLAEMAGDKAAGLQAIAKLQQGKIYDGETSYYLAVYFAYFGEQELAFEHLDQAIDLGYYNVQFIANNIALKKWEDEAGFKALLKKAKARQEQFLKSFNEVE